MKYSISSANNSEFDQPIYSGESINYFICFVARSGSWLLCDLLRASGNMGVPAEYLGKSVYGIRQLADRFGLVNNDRVQLNEYLDTLKKYRTTPNGVFGLKIEPRDMKGFIEGGNLSKHFPDTKFIFLYRRDLLAQGVSYEIARQTRHWQDSRDRLEPKFDAAQVRNAIDSMAGDTTWWEVFFSLRNIEPYRLDYETLIANPQGVCSEICKFIGVETDHEFAVEGSNFVKQSNSINDDWVRRIQQLSLY